MPSSKKKRPRSASINTTIDVEPEWLAGESHPPPAEEGKGRKGTLPSKMPPLPLPPMPIPPIPILPMPFSATDAEVDSKRRALGNTIDVEPDWLDRDSAPPPAPGKSSSRSAPPAARPRKRSVKPPPIPRTDD